MAAQGTGLPTGPSGGITPLADMSSFGAAERANATGLTEAAQGLGRLQKQVLSPLLEEQGRKDAAAAVMAGRFEERGQLTEYGQAFDEVMMAGTLARLATDDERAMDSLVEANPYEPEAFATASAAYRTQALERTPSALAMQRAATLDRRRANQLSSMRLARVRADAQEASVTLAGRKEDLIGRLSRNAEAAAAFTDADPRFADDLQELSSVYRLMASNPVLGLAPEETERLLASDIAKFQAAAIAGHVRRVFREQGQGAALAEIQALLPVDTGEAPGDAPAEPDDATGLPTQTLRGEARELAYDRAFAAYNEENGLAQQRNNIAVAERTAASQRVDDLITAMRYGGAVDSQELMALANASGDPGLVARARFAIEVGVQPPEGFGGGSGGFNGDATAAGGFQAAVDFVIDDLEGGEAFVPDDNGRGPTRFGINSAANPDLDIANLSRAGAVARYRRNYWDAIGADQLPPALALVAFDAAVNHGPADARRWIEESGGDVGRYLALREADYRNLAASSSRQARNLEGWLSRLQTVRQRAARVQAFQNTQDGFSGDPIAFALGNANRPALANVVPLPVDAVFSSQTQGAWGQLLQGRRATGQTLASQYQVPARMLTDGEAQAYKDRFERDPASAITFAQAATAAIGGQGARDLLAEVGQGGAAPTIIHIADLGRPGGDMRFAVQAAQGLAYKAAGQTLEPDDRDAVAASVDRYRTSFRSSPALLAAVQTTAEAAALADRTTGRMQEPDYYAQAAMGRTSWQGRTYGGGAAINGANVVVPRWLNPEYFDDALEALAEGWAPQGIGPVYANGQPIPARRVARLNPVLMPDGRYRLVDDRGNVALARDGSAYDVNLDAGRDFVRRRLGPNAVRPD